MLLETTLARESKRRSSHKQIKPISKSDKSVDIKQLPGSDKEVSKRHEILNEKVFVALEPFQNAKIGEMKIFQDSLSQLPFVKFVESDVYFDRLIRGRVKNGIFHVCILNLSGDLINIEPKNTIQEAGDRIEGHLKYTYLVKKLAGIRQDYPPFQIRVWVTDKTRRDFKIGEKIVFGLESDRNCYALLFNIDSDGNIHVIFPNSYQQENFIKANTPVFVPADSLGENVFHLEFTPPAGVETVKVIASIKPLILNNLDLIGRSGFQTISGTTREIFVKKLIGSLSESNFDWSEDTVVIRSHSLK